MIGVYVVVNVKAASVAKFEEILKIIVPASQKDKGCINYECGAIVGQNGAYVFLEIRQSLQDQKDHMNSPHMRENAATLARCYDGEPQINFINLVDWGKI